MSVRWILNKDQRLKIFEVFLHLTPDFPLLASSFMLRAIFIRHPTPDTGLRSSVFRLPASCFELPASCYYEKSLKIHGHSPCLQPTDNRQDSRRKVSLKCRICDMRYVICDMRYAIWDLRSGKSEVSNHMSAISNQCYKTDAWLLAGKKNISFLRNSYTGFCFTGTCVPACNMWFLRNLFPWISSDFFSTCVKWSLP